MSRNSVIVVAAGKGKRMGAGINKLFLKLNGKPILFYTLSAFSNNSSIDEIILVCNKNEIEYCKEEIVKKYDIKKVSQYVEGGSERIDSVMNGLRAAKACDIVLIHDGARPFVDEQTIWQGIEKAKLYGASACGVLPKDTIKVRGANGFSLDTLRRDSLFCVQTPQCFQYELILRCHELIKKSNMIDMEITDDTMVVEIFGNKVYLYEGSYNNIKVTTSEDLVIAEKILSDLG